MERISHTPWKSWSKLQHSKLDSGVVTVQSLLLARKLAKIS
jgi:hypothetical protein